MSSHGKAENEQLKQNLQDQLDRLVEQLEDLEKCRDELDSAEYAETKEDTMEQLKELNVSLKKLAQGDISLIDSLGAMQLATEAAISQAFRTPEVIRLFGRREPKQLREKLESVEQDHRLGRLSAEVGDRQKAEILTALRQLGERLSAGELQFLEKHGVTIASAFKNVEFVQVDADD